MFKRFLLFVTFSSSFACAMDVDQKHPIQVVQNNNYILPVFPADCWQTVIEKLIDSHYNAKLYPERAFLAGRAIRSLSHTCKAFNRFINSDKTTQFSLSTMQKFCHLSASDSACLLATRGATNFLASQLDIAKFPRFLKSDYETYAPLTQAEVQNISKEDIGRNLRSKVDFDQRAALLAIFLQKKPDLNDPENLITGDTKYLLNTLSDEPRLMSLLLAHGADPCKVDSLGNTPLSNCWYQELSVRMLKHVLGTVDQLWDNRTSLSHAAQRNHSFAVRYLLELGADPLLVSSDDLTHATDYIKNLITEA